MAKKPSDKNEATGEEAGAAPGPEGVAGNGVAPSMRVLAQYLKDLSFENPNAPQSLMNEGSQPQIDVSDPPVWHTYTMESTVFAAEMLYAGIFRLENIPEEHMHPLVLIECPRMIFPFARQILAEATRNGGFPPLLLDPIDFGAMYQQRMEAEGSEPKIS